MIIDAHVHIFPPDAIADRERLMRRDAYFAGLYSSPRARMATAEDLIQAMDEAAIDQAVVASFGWRDHAICREHNAYLLESIRCYPSRLMGLAVANPRYPSEAEKVLVDGLSAGLSGIGELMPDGQGYCIGSDDLQDALASVARAHGVPLLLHVSEPVGHQYPGKGTVAMEQVLSFAQRHPDITLVCAHWGGGLIFYELMPEVRAALANVYYDTAAWPLLYEDKIFQAAAYIAPTKVLFATDYPLVSERKGLDRIRSLGLEPSIEEGYLGGNAAHVYRRR
ncbi:MAG: amidohydrolase family protein [Anaerolineae bacterium]